MQRMDWERLRAGLLHPRCSASHSGTSRDAAPCLELANQTGCFHPDTRPQRRRGKPFLRLERTDPTRGPARPRGRGGGHSPWWPGGTLTRLDRRNFQTEKEFKPARDRATEGNRWPGSPWKVKD
jgi:hypothetical protein